MLGAPYVLRRPPGLSPMGREPSDCSWSETDLQSSTERRGKGREKGEASSSALQAQLRALALRNFAQLFKQMPKALEKSCFESTLEAFFGRWPLVLDFQSGEASGLGLCHWLHGEGLMIGRYVWCSIMKSRESSIQPIPHSPTGPELLAGHRATLPRMVKAWGFLLCEFRVLFLGCCCFEIVFIQNYGLRIP